MGYPKAIQSLTGTQSGAKKIHSCQVNFTYIGNKVH